jgi:hypothetical protein
MSTLYVDTITEKTSGNGVQIADLVPAAGSVVQVVSATKTDTQSISGTTFTDVLTATITPKFANSKIYIKCDLNFTGYNTSNSALGERYSAAKLYRDATQIALGDAAGSRAQVWFSCNAVNELNAGHTMFHSSGSFYDSPATISAITYKVKCGNTNSSYTTTVINSAGPDADAVYSHRGASTLTLMEIAQ